VKNILIISPNFPPINTADMHRVRQSVGYFKELGWKPTVVTVDPRFSEYNNDPLLLETLPEDLEVVQVQAFAVKWTRKLGLGSLALRSLWFYLQKVNHLLRQRRFDLIYFSTTMFPVLILGAYWKKRFQIPYIIDMQDPWHTDYYQNKSKDKRPPKYWLSYRLNKYLEPVAMRNVDGIIAVSEAYCEILIKRYSNISSDRCSVITFGAFVKDFELLRYARIENKFFEAAPDIINVVYVGVVGHNMQHAVSLIMQSLNKGKKEQPELFNKLRLYFIGTDYATTNPTKTVEPIAQKYNVASQVFEFPNRVSYIESLKLINDADLLMIFGTDDPKYTASKIYPYILSNKPLLAVFHEKSSVISILQQTNAGTVVPFSNEKYEYETLYLAWKNILEKLPFIPATNWNAFEPYTAREMALKQISFFNKILDKTFD
jgi:glycosyltransferase involved in cell wall biosynthesis